MADFPKKTLADWEKAAAKELRDKPVASLDWMTPEGILVKPLYTAADLENLEAVGSLPGFPPFTRGPKATMYTGRPWTVRQYAGFSTAEESNKFYRANLAAGQMGLSVAFDLATHRGYDSDHPRVVGDVGKAGVAIDSVEDMKILFDGIPLDKMSVSMTMNGAVLPVLAGYIVAAEEQGVPQDKLSGTIQNDILKEFMVRNTYIYPPGPSMRIVADIIEHTAQHMPKFNSISISGYHMQEAGSTLVQELAFTLADGLEYVRAAKAKGLDIDAFAPRLSFFFCIGMNFFMEVAKLRAARFLWAELIKPFEPKKADSLSLRTHCQTSGVSLTEQDPYNNVIRTAYEAMAARAGRHAVAAHQFLRRGDRAADADLVAHRAQHAAHPAARDRRHPDGRSAGRQLLRRMAHQQHDRGGAQADRRGRGAGRHDQGGRGRHAQDADRGSLGAPPGPHRSRRGRHRRREQVPAQGRHRPSRSWTSTTTSCANRRSRVSTGSARAATRPSASAALKALGEAARSGTGNLLALSIEATRARATVGEISSALEGVFGRYQATVRSISGVYAGEWEGDGGLDRIRTDIAAFAEEEGRRPRLMVVKMGQDGHDRGAKVIATAFADLGFDVDIGPLFQTPAEAARAAIENDVHVIGVSSQAAGHKTLVPQLIDELAKQGGSEVLVVVGGVIPRAGLRVPQEGRRRRDLSAPAPTSRPPPPKSSPSSANAATSARHSSLSLSLPPRLTGRCPKGRRGEATRALESFRSETQESRLRLPPPALRPPPPYDGEEEKASA